MLLYAEITWKFKYTFKLNKVVKKLKESQSAGNCNLDNLLWFKTSETLSNKTVLRKIIHKPKHNKPLNDEQFGYYLAGLIERNGYIKNNLILIIQQVFRQLHDIIL